MVPLHTRQLCNLPQTRSTQMRPGCHPPALSALLRHPAWVPFPSPQRRGGHATGVSVEPPPGLQGPYVILGLSSLPADQSGLTTGPRGPLLPGAYYDLRPISPAWTLHPRPLTCLLNLHELITMSYVYQCPPTGQQYLNLLPH